MLDLEKVYLKLPSGLQTIAFSMEGARIEARRYGREFRRAEGAASASANLSGGELARLHRARLRELLDHATSSPFWARRFADAGVDPQGPDPIEELFKLPVLTKADVQANLGDFRTQVGRARSGLLVAHTSGTTGSGLVFPETRAADAFTWATWWRYRGWHGIQRGRWCGYFGGRTVVPSSQSTPPYWRTNYPGRQVQFSAYHLSEDTAAAYLSEIRRRGLTWLHGYPSFLGLLANFALDSGAPAPVSVEIVTTGAENLLSHQRDSIERAFGSRVTQHYGQRESVANFSECPKGRLHVDEDFSIVEFLPSSGGEDSRIVGTNLRNSAFPLLRYDTGDRAIVTGSECDCGRVGRVVDAVDGRQEDYLILSDGSRVGRLDHLLKDMTSIREAQFRQSVPGEAELLVVPGPDYADLEEHRLGQEVLQRLGGRLRVSVRLVDRVPRTQSGKLRFVVSSLPAGRLTA